MGKHSVNEDHRTYNWLDCGANFVAEGIRQGGDGQLVRLYFEQYGKDAVGRHDKGHGPSRRVLDVRATESMRLGDAGRPTFVFHHDDGSKYVWAARKALEDIFWVDHETPALDPSERLLARETDEGAEVVGCHVAFAVPEHKHMTPL